MLGLYFNGDLVSMHWPAHALRIAQRQHRRRVLELEAIANPSQVERDKLRLARLHLERIEYALTEQEGRDRA